MIGTEYIRAAVELADGWTISGSVAFPPSSVEIGMSLHNTSTWILDALAAQLRRQCGVDITFRISVVDSASYVTMKIFNPGGDEEAEPLTFLGHETDEALAFIKAIVDSKVLT